MLSGVGASVPRSSLEWMQGWGALQLSQNKNNTCSDTAILSRSNRTSKQENTKPVNLFTMMKRRSKGFRFYEHKEGILGWLHCCCLGWPTSPAHGTCTSPHAASSQQAPHRYSPWPCGTHRQPDTQPSCGGRCLHRHAHTQLKQQAALVKACAVLQVAIRVMGLLKVTSFCSRRCHNAAF